MRNNILIRLLMVTALLMFAIPVVASAQVYDRDRYDPYDRSDRDDVHEAIVRLQNSSARLESNLSTPRGRRVMGFFWVNNRDTSAIAEIRDFRRVVRELRLASDGGRDLRNSYDEARIVLDRGLRLDRNLRLRTGRTDVDAELAEIRSNLHVLADAYGMSRRF